MYKRRHKSSTIYDRIRSEAESANLGRVGHYSLAIVEKGRPCTWFGETGVPVAKVWRPYHPRIVPALIERFRKDTRYNHVNGTNDIRLDKTWTFEDAVQAALDFFSYVVVIGEDGTREVRENPNADVHVPENEAFAILPTLTRIKVGGVVSAIEDFLGRAVDRMALFDGVGEHGFMPEFFPSKSMPDEVHTRHSRILVRVSISDGKPRYLAVNTRTMAVEGLGYHQDGSSRRLIALWHDAMEAEGICVFAPTRLPPDSTDRPVG